MWNPLSACNEIKHGLSLFLTALMLPQCRGSEWCMVHLYFIKPFLSILLPLTSSFSQYRAVFCQHCGVGTSHLLLLQRDSHGVQLPGKGDENMFSRLLNTQLCWSQSIQGICEYVNVSLKCKAMKGDARLISSLQLLFECRYFPTTTLTFHPHIFFCLYI